MVYNGMDSLDLENHPLKSVSCGEPLGLELCYKQLTLGPLLGTLARKGSLYFLLRR